MLGRLKLLHMAIVQFSNFWNICPIRILFYQCRLVLVFNFQSIHIFSKNSNNYCEQRKLKYV